MTNARHVLTFDLNLETDTQVNDYDDEKVTTRAYITAEAMPLVNGMPMLEGPVSYVFDTASVICRGLEPSDFNPYTCGCGVAECAGIWDHVRLEADEHEVRWVLPEEPYREKLNPALQVAGEPLVLTFAREQYAAALTELEQRLLTLEKESAQPVVLLPESHPNLDENLEFCLERGKTNILNWIASERHRKAIFGKLLDQEIDIVFDSGFRYILPVSSVAYEQSFILEKERGTSRQELLEQEILPVFHASPDAILDIVRSLSWDCVQHMAWFQADEEPEQPPEELADLPKEWLTAQLTLRTGANE